MKRLFIAVAVLLFAAGCSGKAPESESLPSESPSPSAQASDLPTMPAANPTPACHPVTDNTETAYFLRVATRAAKISVNVTFQKTVTTLCSAVKVGAAWYTVRFSDQQHYDVDRLDSIGGAYDGGSELILNSTQTDPCHPMLVLAYVGDEPENGDFPQLKTPEFGDKKYLETTVGGRLVAAEYYPGSIRC